MRAYIWILLLAFFLLNACAVTKQDLEDLQKRVDDSDAKVLALEARINQMPATTTIDNEEISKLTQQNQHIFSQIQNMNNRISSLEDRPVVSTPAPVEPNKYQSEEVQTKSEISPEKYYRDGRDLYESKDYPGAITTFTQLLHEYPNNEYAGNAQYWIGESYYGLADFSAAYSAFKKVIDHYPSCPKYIDSQVKVALTLINQNQKSKAKVELQRIKAEYPKYERMNIVDEWLKKLH